RRQADALGFSARQRFGAAIQAEVVQRHVVEEFQAQADLANHLLRDLGLRAVQLQAVEILEAFAQREVADFVDRAGLLAIPDLDVPGLAAQARAVAFATRLLATVARQFLPHRHRIALAVTPFHVGNYAFKRVLL